MSIKDKISTKKISSAPRYFRILEDWPETGVDTFSPLPKLETFRCHLSFATTFSCNEESFAREEEDAKIRLISYMNEELLEKIGSLRRALYAGYMPDAFKILDDLGRIARGIE